MCVVIPGFLQQPGVPTFFSHPCLKHEREHEHLSSSSMRLPAP